MIIKNKTNISKIINTHIYNAKCIDIAMPMYNVIKCSYNYSKTSWILWQYYIDNNNNNSASFKYKNSGENNKRWHKTVETMVVLEYLSNLQRTLWLPLINCELNPILTWSSNCFIIDDIVNN